MNVEASNESLHESNLLKRIWAYFLGATAQQHFSQCGRCSQVGNFAYNCVGTTQSRILWSLGRAVQLMSLQAWTVIRGRWILVDFSPSGAKPSKMSLMVVVVGAKNLPNIEKFGKIDPIAEVTFAGRRASICIDSSLYYSVSLLLTLMYVHTFSSKC